MSNHGGGTASNFLWYIKKARITAGNTVAIAGAQWRLRSGANVEIEGEHNLHQLCSQDNLHRSYHKKVFIRIVFISLVVNMNFMNCVLRIIFIGLVVYIIFISCIVRIIRFLHSHHQLHFRYLRFGKIFINYILRIFRLVIIFIIWAFSTFIDDQECVTFTCVLLYWRLNIFSRMEWETESSQFPVNFIVKLPLQASSPPPNQAKSCFPLKLIFYHNEYDYYTSI